MKKLRLLLIVGCANDIFIYNMAKWLKAKMNVSIDVFEFYPSNKQGYGSEYYDDVITVNQSSWIKRNKYSNSLFFDFYAARELDIFLKNKQYDAIQCHWIVPPMVLSRELLRVKAKTYLTFWGREYVNFRILFSQKIYKYKLDKLVKSIDYIVNSEVFIRDIFAKLYPNFSGKCLVGHLGSASIDFIYDMLSNNVEHDIKNRLGIDSRKYSVLIGYSGKSLHQHIKIIEELEKIDLLKNKIHLLVPMTRGGGKEYIDEVESNLIKSGFTYTLLKDRFLSDEEIAELRVATDIVLQLSTTDGFSRSILECLCAKSLMIYGEWLNYDLSLRDNKLWAIKVSSINEAVVTLCDIISRYNDYLPYLENNSNNGKEQNSWSFCINNWVDAYKLSLE